MVTVFYETYYILSWQLRDVSVLHPAGPRMTKTNPIVSGILADKRKVYEMLPSGRSVAIAKQLCICSDISVDVACLTTGYTRS